MIELQGVTKLFGDQKALGPVDLQIPPGLITVLAGPSGSGKSTLLKLINRILEPNEGTILIQGRSIKTQDPINLRRSLGWVIQNTGLFPHMNVAENIAVVPKLLKWSQKDIDKRVRTLLNLMELPYSFSHKYPHELSGGEAQRVGVARALGADPPILLMDEPFGSLDPQTRESLQNQLQTLQKELKKTVLLVTHEIDEALKLGDRMVILKSGRVMGFGTPESLGKELGEIADFLGRDYPIKLLSRRYPVPGSPSAKELLALMLRENTRSLTLDTGENWGWDEILGLGDKP